jgi:lipoprotein-anchoring transpeptidase ErfK/SrfK
MTFKPITGSLFVALCITMLFVGTPPAQAMLRSNTPAQTTAVITMYEGPDVYSRIQRNIGAGVEVAVVAGPENTDWYKITYNGTTGYVRESDLRQNADAVTIAAAKLRTQPDTDHDVLATIPSKSAVTITRGPVNKTWYEIVYDGQTGYVSATVLARQGNGGAKLIVVDISDQWVYAYEGGEQIFAAPTSTGKAGFSTPTGTFAVERKYAAKAMRGSRNDESWYAPSVPYVMFFTDRGHALHGAPWLSRSVFGSGTRRSHGCVNLPVSAAAWFFDWAAIGTEVQVRP